MLLPLVKPR
jgi:hypothetical protein